MSNQTEEHWTIGLRTSAGNWINSADTKTTALVTIQGAVLAIALASSSIQTLRLPPKIAFLVFAASNLLSITFSAAVLWPRTNRKSLLDEAKKPDKDRTKVSFSTFVDIGQMKWGNFSSLLTTTPSATDLESDRHEQSYLLARIAVIKLQWLQRAIIALSVSFVALALVVGLAAFMPPSEPQSHPAVSAAVYPVATPTPEGQVGSPSRNLALRPARDVESTVQQTDGGDRPHLAR